MLALKLKSGMEQGVITNNMPAVIPFGKGNAMLFSDALERCRRERKTGLLSVTVLQSARFLVRVYFSNGAICRLSYGPLQGRECLEFLEYYDFGEAVYLDGMKAPHAAASDLITDDIIAAVRETGKTIRVKQWLERRGERV